MSDVPFDASLVIPGTPAPDLRHVRPDDPALMPGLSFQAVTDRIAAIPLRHRAFLWWYALTAMFASWALALVIAVIWVFYRGPGIYGLAWPVDWGFDIIDYVYWIGIACGCAFISAGYYLIDADWRAGIGRIADACALIAGACGGIFPIIHLGRPWLFYWLFPYPNMMGYWPNWRSPLEWDFWGVLSFVGVSGCWVLLGLVPDLAVLRDRAATRGRAMIYGVAAMGFRGSGRQWRFHNIIVRAMAIVMLVAAIDTHSIAGLDFAGGLTPGWHSTIMAPYFVFGAVLSGAAMILLVALPLRRLLRLGQMITGRHIDMLCKIMFCSSLLVTYSYAIEAFMAWYGGARIERTMYAERVFGQYEALYWTAIAFNCVLPQIFWIRRLRFVQPLVWFVSFLVLIGMWMDAFETVVTSLTHPHVPSAWGLYRVSTFDWLTLLGSVGLFFFLVLIAVRVLPMAPITQLRRMLLEKLA